MGLDSHREERQAAIATLPNAMTATRAAGGIALGIALATGSVDPGLAIAGAGLLAASDAEGNVIDAAKKHPRLQKVFSRLKLPVIASHFGYAADPIADKIFAGSVIAGSMIGGEMPDWQGGSMLLTEFSTAAASIAVKAMGKEVEASTAGKIGMGVRCAVIIADLLASAVGSHSGLSHEILADTGDGLAVGAFALGSLSFATVIRRRNGRPTELPAANPGV